MDKAEAKFANTAKKMDGALLALLEDKPFDAITVTDVCREAGVHRSTFYSHYGNTTDLLSEVKDATLAGFYASFDHLPREGGFLTREYLDAYLRFVESNERVFRVFLENLSLFDGRDILTGFEEDLASAPRKKNAQRERTSRYRLVFVASGITSIVSLWLESGCKEKRGELVDIILDCIRGHVEPGRVPYSDAASQVARSCTSMPS